MLANINNNNNKKKILESNNNIDSKKKKCAFGLLPTFSLIVCHDGSFSFVAVVRGNKQDFCVARGLASLGLFNFFFFFISAVRVIPRRLTIMLQLNRYYYKMLFKIYLHCSRSRLNIYI
jgi:hypothetical protein